MVFIQSQDLAPVWSCFVKHQAGLFAWFRLQHSPGWSQIQPQVQFSNQLLCPALGTRKHVCASYEQVQASHSALVSLTSFQTTKRACIPCVEPQSLGTQYVARTPHSPGKMSTHVIFLFPLSSLPGAKVPTWLFLFPSCSNPHGPWFTALVV